MLSITYTKNHIWSNSSAFELQKSEQFMAKSCLLILTANLIKFAHFYLHEKQNLRTFSLYFLDGNNFSPSGNASKHFLCLHRSILQGNLLFNN